MALRSSSVSGKHSVAEVSSYGLRFVNDRTLVPLARHAAAKYARGLSVFDGDALGDIELAVGEALANAVEHGRCDGSYISLMCESRGDAFEVTISDDGCGFDAQAFAEPDPAAERGYGICIMRRTMDRVDFLRGGKTVRMLKRFAAPRAAARAVNA